MRCAFFSVPKDKVVRFLDENQLSQNISINLGVPESKTLSRFQFSLFLVDMSILPSRTEWRNYFYADDLAIGGSTVIDYLQHTL